MIITVAFTDNGSPATGLSPVMDAWDVSDGTQVLTASAMTEVAGGFYKYEFTGYDFLTDYVFRAYESTLADGEQYVFASNDNDSQNNQGIVKQILGLVMGNTRVTNQVYDGDGNLLTANVYTYPTATDATNETNVLHSYAITATYTAGKLTSYKSVEL